MVRKTGNYVNKATGEVVNFDFDVCNDVAELRSITTEAERDALALRMHTTDARNTASAKAQAANGHNAKVMTAEQKEASKAARAADKALLAKLKANPELMAELGL